MEPTDAKKDGYHGDHFDPAQVVTNEYKDDELFQSFKELTEEDIPANPFIFISSPRRAGKSEVTLHILRQFHTAKRFTHYGLVSQTLSGYEGVVPYTYQWQTMEHVGDIITKCQDVAEYNSKVKEKGQPAEHYIDCSFCLVLDDVIGDPKDLKRVGGYIQKIAVNGRHIMRADPHEKNEFGLILISQKITSIPPVIRQNADLICSARLASRVERQTYIENFLTLTSGRDGLKDARRVFDSITLQEYTFICVLAYKSIRVNHQAYVRRLKADITAKTERLFGTEKDWKARKPRINF